jgi:hypothetical protein
VRLWGTARAPAEVRRTMRVPLEDTRGGTLRLRFDEPVPAALLARPAAADVYGPSTLSFAHPVEALDAAVEDGAVGLTWETKSREATRFIIERSTDGQRFESVGAVAVDERVAEGADGTMRFRFADRPPETALLYYRIRQEFADEDARTSATIKLGIGDEGQVRAAILGNAPNPFRSATEVRYEVSEAGPVRLSLWSVAGVRVAVLVDEAKAAGQHTYRLDASGLPSGVYFVRLEAAGTATIHKVTLTQ